MMYKIDIELTEESFKNKCLEYDFDPEELEEDISVTVTRSCNTEDALSMLPKLLDMISEWKVASIKITEL